MSQLNEKELATVRRMIEDFEMRESFAVAVQKSADVSIELQKVGDKYAAELDAIDPNDGVARAEVIERMTQEAEAVKAAME